MQTRFSLLSIVVGSLVGFAAFGHPSSIQIPAKSDQDTADRYSGVIRGRVFTAEGESPLARVTVTLFSSDGRGNERPRTVRTDNRGEYQFRDLEVREVPSAGDPQRLPSSDLRPEDILGVGKTAKRNASLACVGRDPQ